MSQKLAEDLLTTIAHEYDAAKRREYYLRTRQLKGRKTGSGDDPQYGSRSTAKAPVKKPRASVDVAAEVAAIKAKIERLKAALQKLVAEAKERAGVDEDDEKRRKSTSSKSGGSTGQLSAKEKRARAENLKAARKEQSKTDPNKKTKAEEEAEIAEKIAKVRMQIFEAREKLKAAVARAQAQEKNKPRDIQKTA
jgi:hypothetical protein